MRNSSYLTKLIMFGCILCTVPVLCFGIFSYFQSSTEIQKQVNRVQMQLLEQMNSKVEETLLTINHALNQLVDSTVVSKVMKEPFSSDDYQLYNNLRKEISNTQSFYTKLDDVVIINFRQNWMIKNSGFYRFDEYLHSSQISYEQMLPQTTSWVLNPTLWFYSEEKADAVACPYTISLIKKLPEQSLDKFGLAYANLSACNIADILKYTPRDSETLMIMDERGQLLYHSDVSMIGKYAASTDFFYSMSMFVHSSGQFQTSKDGRTYTATYLKSHFNNWVYVSIVPIDSLTEEAKKIGNLTVIVCLIIVAVFVMIAWLGSRSMYTPIRQLVRQIADKVPHGKGRRINEFEVIGDRIQDLFRSNSELTREVHHHLHQARSFFLIKMFQSGFRRKDLMERLELFGFLEKMESWRRMAVITMQVDTLENTNYEKDDMELLLFAVGNIIEEMVPADTRLPPVFIEQTQVTLIGTTEEDAESFTRYLYEVTESIQSAVAEILKLSISIGISLPFEDPKRATLAYREGQEALKHRIHLGSGLIISYTSINPGKHRLTLDYPSMIESELSDAIMLAEETKARDLLERFMQTVFKHEMTPQEYQVPMFRLLNKLLVIMQESGVPLTQLQPEGGSLYEELQKLQIATEIEEWFWSRVIAPMLRIFQHRQNSQYQNISEQVIDMIHKRYDTDLTIEKCAAALHYNANYLSGVFRKETSSTFSDYLTAYRFNIAKKWLATTDMTIKEIAERLQYMNSQNFIRSFRKQEKMTPGQYRDMYRK